MTKTSPYATVVPVTEIALAARELAHAGRWSTATRLLDSSAPADARHRTHLAVTAAEVALDQDWFTGTATAAERITTAEALSPQGTDRWDLAFVRLRHTYAQLLLPDGTFRFGPDGKDPDALAALRREADNLRTGAPDEARRGWASLCTGLITDNLCADRESAPAHYELALHTGESTPDDLLSREALRHLGDHDHDAGDNARALPRWRRATALGARAGTVPGTLSQQLLLAVLARDAGDEPAATALATEVARWAGAIGAVRIEAQAAGFLAGADPTAGPEGDS